MFMERGIEIPKNIAGIMLSAIISDTLMYRSPTCTEIDKIAGERLAEIAEVNAEELAKEMFNAGSDLGNKTPEEIVHQDFKKFTVGDNIIGIGQISSMDEKEIENIKDRVKPELLTGANAEIIMESGFSVSSKDHMTVRLPGVVSRKKQMLPTLTTTINLT